MFDKILIDFKKFLIKNGYDKFFYLLQKVYFLLKINVNILNYLLNPIKILNYKKYLKKFYKIHDGEICYIIGGAPSINQLDLSKLNNKTVFTVNKGYLLKDKGLKRSKYHLITDKKLWKELKYEDLKYSENYFFGLNVLPKIKNFYFIKDIYGLNFQKDISKGVFTYGTVISCAIQIATYMGFKKIYLLGVDLSFNIDNSHFYKDAEKEKERTYLHSLDNKDNMYKSIIYCKEILDSMGIDLINLSPINDSLPGIKKEHYNSIL